MVFLYICFWPLPEPTLNPPDDGFCFIVDEIFFLISNGTGLFTLPFIFKLNCLSDKFCSLSCPLFQTSCLEGMYPSLSQYLFTVVLGTPIRSLICLMLNVSTELSISSFTFSNTQKTTFHIQYTKSG
ncbi:hypothetical protein D3C71_1022720 [compost metagenome]